MAANEDGLNMKGDDNLRKQQMADLIDSAETTAAMTDAMAKDPNMDAPPPEPTPLDELAGGDGASPPAIEQKPDAEGPDQKTMVGNSQVIAMAEIRPHKAQ